MENGLEKQDISVSYTHLDVYKRQLKVNILNFEKSWNIVKLTENKRLGGD